MEKLITTPKSMMTIYDFRHRRVVIGELRNSKAQLQDWAFFICETLNTGRRLI